MIGPKWIMNWQGCVTRRYWPHYTTTMSLKTGCVYFQAQTARLRYRVRLATALGVAIGKRRCFWMWSGQYTVQGAVFLHQGSVTCVENHLPIETAFWMWDWGSEQNFPSSQHSNTSQCCCISCKYGRYCIHCSVLQCSSLPVSLYIFLHRTPSRPIRRGCCSTEAQSKCDSQFESSLQHATNFHMAQQK
jgi:hypothetical protein